jgi:hypothetical protein
VIHTRTLIQGVRAIDLHVPDLATLHEQRSEKWTGHDNDVLVATIAEMDFPLAEPVAEVLRAAIDRSDLGYATPAPRRLRDAFAGFARRRLRWDVDPEQITLVPDVMVGLVELSRVLAGRHGAVAFMTPAYPPFFTALPHAVARLEHLPALEDGAVDLEALARSIAGGTRVLILTNPHNPTGRVLPRPELEAIAELCAEREVWVLADEIHAPLVLPGAEHTPWPEVSDAARACGVALTSASKALKVAGLKAALLVTARTGCGVSSPASPISPTRLACSAFSPPRRRSPREMRGSTPSSRSSTRIGRCLENASPRRCRQFAGSRAARASLPGWTAARSASETTQQGSSSSAGAWRSAPASTTAARAPGSRA